MQPVNETENNKSQLIYSLFLIILIPGMMIFNIFWTWRSVKNTTDNELRQKAMLVNSVIGSLVDENTLSELDSTQKKLDSIQKDSPELIEVSVIKNSNEGFVVFASTNKAKINTLLEGVQANIAWQENKPVAILGNYSKNESIATQRVWSVTTSISDETGKIGLVDTKVSLYDIDELTKSSLQQSLLILICAIIITLLLLINHFRFFETAVLARKLQEIDKMKDDFISIASHELKTPIASIRGYIDNLITGASGKIDEKAKETVQIIAGQAERLNSLINDLLNVSRLEQGRMQFELKPLVISSLIAETVHLLENQAKEKNLYLKFEAPTDTNISINADDNRMREVFMNIIGNAIKYTKKGGVDIYCQVDGKSIKTIVKDSGIGMSPDARKNLFTKFYRIKTEATNDIPGTGLGLWITKEMVQKMGGEIYVDSMEGVGSQFAVMFPIKNNKK